MEIYKLKQDIKVVCVEARSFPGGIKEAFAELCTAIPDAQGRPVFGISKPQNGVIVYRAAAKESFAGEATQLGYPTFVIEAGLYMGETLMDWQQNEMMIMSIFNRLIADKRLDGSAHCIEWYKSGTELLCMVLMNNNMITQEIKELPL